MSMITAGKSLTAGKVFAGVPETAGMARKVQGKDSGDVPDGRDDRDGNRNAA
jgi:hypothetical protein